MNEQTLLKRINRKLAHEDYVVRKTRGFEPSLGDFYMVETTMNVVGETHIDLEELGAELGVDR